MVFTGITKAKINTGIPGKMERYIFICLSLISVYDA